MKFFVMLLTLSLLLSCSPKQGGSLVSDSVEDANGSLGEAPARADDPSIIDGELVGEIPDEVDPTIGDIDTGEGEDPKLDTPVHKTTFKVDSGLYSLDNGAGTVAVRWAGCDNNQYAQGGYDSDTRCGKAFLLPAFRLHLEKHFQNCVLSAAREAGLSKPHSAFIRHIGTFNNRDARGSSRKSMHAFARALDLVNLNLFDSQGRKTLISTHVRDYDGATAQFYNSFRLCWAESMPSSCSPGQTEYLGSIGHTSSQLGGNSLHSDHLHISYPLCAGGN